MARTALGERAAHLMEAARLLGAPLTRRIATIALPLARPAVAAGVALALMETLVPLRGVRCGLAWLVCAVPVLMGFVAPVAFMLRPLASDWSVLPWGRFLEWAWNSVRLGGITAGLAVVVALALAFAARRRPDLLTRGVVRLASVGYAVPGAVIVVGLLLPVGWLQERVPGWGVGALVGKVTGSGLAGDVAGSVNVKKVNFSGRLDARLIEVETGEILVVFKDESEVGDTSSPSGSGCACRASRRASSPSRSRC